MPISSRHSNLSFAHHFVFYRLFQNDANKNQRQESHQKTKQNKTKQNKTKQKQKQTNKQIGRAKKVNRMSKIHV